MAWWEWLLDISGIALLLLLAYGVGLVLRRRLLARHGGTFELSHRMRTDAAGRGWVLGMGRYSGEKLEWFRIFTLWPRPNRVWHREQLTFDGRREPVGAEHASLYPDHVVIRCAARSGEVESIIV